MRFALDRGGPFSWGAIFVALVACRDETKTEPTPLQSSKTPEPTGQSAPLIADSAPQAPPPAPELRCPNGMQLVPGGESWVGSEKGQGSDDERPRYKTQLASLCVDETEVTVRSYLECVAAEACKPPEGDSVHCNSRGSSPRDGREDHPVNCVSFYQAEAFCAWNGRRLPSEAEWEYVARGGPQDLEYSWGNEPPSEQTCWKHNGTCAVKSFAPGAYGLHDLTGNVWEWTQDWYGAYPWPPVDAWAKVYRGGGWSRRFEKWMRTRLRNRENPRSSGSHLGFRCALTPPGEPCPNGRTKDGRGCLHVVLDRACPSGETFNGARCAAPSEPLCSEGRVPEPGHGCVLPGAGKPTFDPNVDTSGVSRRRSPEFDADCQQYQAARPTAFRYVGGTHAARNLVGAQAGCKNRDVGVGWNSACCP